MASLELIFPNDALWFWDNKIGGIGFLRSSASAVPNERHFRLTKKTHSHVSGTLFSDLRLSFREVPGVHDLVRFRRLVQRPAEDHDDIVTLTDIKDVVLFQVKQHVSQFFLDFFYTPQVDEFLRCLVLYFQHYIQVWEWMQIRCTEHANKIRLPGLRASEVRERQNLGVLRLLVARSYAGLLVGADRSQRFHHAANTESSWSQRDARLWEFLIRISGRVVWVALQRRFLHLIQAEMDRLFRGGGSGGSGVHAGRKVSPLFAAVLHFQSTAPSVPTPKTPRVMSMSPLAQEVLHGGHDWRLLGLGRIPLGDEEDKFQGLLQLISKTEAELASEGRVIGILGMARSEVDAMLTITGKKAPESRPLADVLADAVQASAEKREKPARLSKCVDEFPRVRFSVDADREAELKDARRKWKRNYHRVRQTQQGPYLPQ